jgi:hypothetical integral membrane protein (TIGR02206 family)
MPDPAAQAAQPAPWWLEFHSYFDRRDGIHLFDQSLALAWTLPLIIISCILGRRWLARGEEMKERELAAAWAGFIICVNVWSLFYWLQPEHFDIRNSFPLHLCDMGMLLAPLLFLTRWRPIRALMYFWGIGLSTQAFITPTLLNGIGHPRYWLFWLGHLAIVGSAIYDIVVRRFRPTIRDLLTALGITLAWYIAVGFLNVHLRSNYGYNGPVAPERPTIIDSLGPWPARAVILGLIAVAWFGVLWAIWPISAKLKGSGATK